MTSPNHSRLRSIAIALVALVALTGAKRVDQKLADHYSKNARFKVTLPVGWVMDKSSNSVTVSRDGFGLNSISIARVALKDAFKAQMKEQKDEGAKAPKVVLAADTSPEDLAALQIAERKRANEGVQVLSDEPAMVAGFPAFRVTTELKDERGLRMRMTCYGFIAEDGLVRGCYSAPAIFYYERDLPAFEAMIASLTHVAGKPKKGK